MRMTVFNVDTQLYELDQFGIRNLENVIQKLGIIEDIMEDHGIFSILELKERLDND